MSKPADAFQVSMFDTLPDLAPPRAKASKPEKAEKPAQSGKSGREASPSDQEEREPKARTSPRKRAAPATALASEEAFTLDNFLPYRILQSAQGISRRMSKVLADEVGHEHGRVAGVGKSGTRWLCLGARG